MNTNKIPLSSPELLSFYKAWLAWVDDGCDWHYAFGNKFDLCKNCSIFFHGNDNYLLEMLRQFVLAGLDRNYPFNADWQYYVKEANTGRIPFNLERLQWVKDRISDCEQSQP